MRVLAASTAGAGHLEPMKPFVRALVDAGHELLFAAPEGLVPSLEREGWPTFVLPSPAPEVAGPIYARLPTVTRAEANVLVIRDIFGGANAQAAVPGFEAAVDAFRPDLVLREAAEIASYVVARHRGIEQVQVSIGLGALDDFLAEVMAEAMPERFDLPAAGLRDLRVLSLLPPSLETAVDGLREREYYRAGGEPVAPRLPPGVPADERPLVYVSFGTVAAQVGYFPHLYRTVLDALADEPVRVLMTVGSGDPEQLGPLPDNAHVERFWPQDAVLPVASAVVGHGGFGTTMGALRAGLPLVVLPLFSSDQHLNAAAVAASGAGVSVEEPTVESVGAAVRDVLASPAVRGEAARVAAEIAALPPAARWLDRT